MKGRLIDITIGLNGKQRVTVELDGDFRKSFEDLKELPVSVDIKKFRKQRSRDANAYAWVLIDKIASTIHSDKTTIYRQAIREIGGVSDVVCVKDEAVEQLRKGWEHNGLGWPTDTFPSKITGCTNVILYYGSSTYDTKQMSELIEYLISEAQELGIETDTPEQIEKYKTYWRQAEQKG